MWRLLVLLFLGLAYPVRAQIGWTLDQCREAWGEPWYRHSGYPDGEVLEFRPKQRIYAHFSEDGKVNSVTFWNTANSDNFANTSPLKEDEIKRILDDNTEGCTWDSDQDNSIDQVEHRPAWISRDAKNNIRLVAFLENDDKSQLVVRTYDQFLVAQKNEKTEADKAKDGTVEATTYSEYRDETTEASKFHDNYQSAILNLFKSYLPDPDSIIMQEILPPEDRMINNKLYVVTKARLSTKTPLGNRISHVWGIIFDPATGDVASLDEPTFKRFLVTGNRKLLPKSLSLDDSSSKPEEPTVAAPPDEIDLSERTKMAIEQFVVDYIRAAGSNDTAKRNEYFAPIVTRFYEHTNYSRSEIHKSDAEYSRKWPVRSYEPIEGSCVIREEGKDDVLVTQLFKWTVTNTQRTLRGTSKMVLTIHYATDGGMEIVQIDEKRVK